MTYVPDFEYNGHLFEIKAYVKANEKKELCQKLLASDAVLVVILSESDYQEYITNKGAFLQTIGPLRGLQILKWADEYGFKSVPTTDKSIRRDIDSFCTNQKLKNEGVRHLLKPASGA